MAAPVPPLAPPNPASEEGEVEVVRQTTRALRQLYPRADHALFATLACLLSSVVTSADRGGKLVLTPVLLGAFLSQLYVERGAVMPAMAMWVVVVLTMHSEACIQAGTHYWGQIQLKQDGTPRRNAHNKNLELTERGVFALLGLLMPDRASFLNHTWIVMLEMHRSYKAIKQAYANYMSERDRDLSDRSHAMNAYLQRVCMATGITDTQEANMATLAVAHKEGRKPFFCGLTPAKALVMAELIEEGHNPGVIYRLFSRHGVISDHLRLSTITESIRVRDPEIAAAMDKKRKVREMVRECTELFTQMGTFNIPGFDRTQQIKAFFDQEQIDRVVRRRLDQ